MKESQNQRRYKGVIVIYPILSTAYQVEKAADTIIKGKCFSMSLTYVNIYEINLMFDDILGN